MFGEKFEIYLTSMAKNALKLSTMVGEIFEIFSSQMPKNVFKFSALVGKKFEIYSYQIPTTYSNVPPWLENVLRVTLPKCRKWYSNCLSSLDKILKTAYQTQLKMHLNFQPWLQKILKSTLLECLKISSNCPPMVGENF